MHAEILLQCCIMYCSCGRRTVYEDRGKKKFIFPIFHQNEVTSPDLITSGWALGCAGLGSTASAPLNHPGAIHVHFLPFV